MPVNMQQQMPHKSQQRLGREQKHDFLGLLNKLWEILLLKLRRISQRFMNKTLATKSF
jgi:hypothetical protein